VDVVGFSAGGVTARLFTADGGAPVVRRVVTLGSPHHGTRVAGLAAALAPGACVEACRQLVPGSPALAELNADDETPDGPVWVSVWTRQDEVVTPPESARLDGALEVPLQDVCPDAVVAHGALPRDPLTIGIVLTALGLEEPVQPTAADCATLRARGRA
ncbi:MAG: lipase, partial [Actinomycetota bacterium]|nr:lipase [Actinomycetota bacterium]